MRTWCVLRGVEPPATPTACRSIREVGSARRFQSGSLSRRRTGAQASLPRQEPRYRAATWNIQFADRTPAAGAAMAGRQPGRRAGAAEIKMTDDKFPAAISRRRLQAGGSARRPPTAWRGYPPPPTWCATSRALTTTSRVLTATVDASRVVGRWSMAVNGKAPGSDKFDYEMRGLQALRAWLH